MSKRARVVAALLAVASPLVAADAGAARGQELPLGSPRLEETRTSSVVAPGVRWTRVVRGHRSARERFVVDVDVLDSRADARRLAARLRGQGFDARVVRFAGPLGSARRAFRVFAVRSGAFATRPEADARQAELRAAGHAGASTVYTGDDGKRTSGPWRAEILTIRPWRLSGRLAPVLANELVLGRETTSQMASRTGSSAGTNGGYFVIGGPGDGDPAGTFSLDGDLISETIDGRTNLVLPGAGGYGARLAVLSFRGDVTIDGASRLLDGVDRVRGQIRNCGGRGGDLPTESPLHDVTCTDASELLAITPRFGPTTATTPDGVEAVVRNGFVTAVREGGDTPVPADGYVLTASGDAADFLRANAQPGDRPALDARLLERGRRFAEAHRSVVNGGPALVRDGRLLIRSAEEGFVHPGEPRFYYGFGVRRNPRTLAGIRADGAILLVTIDGRQPDWSVGASFSESADVLRALGSRQGLNLDGGGSTAMTIGGRLVSMPSDLTGERPVSDGLFVLP